MKREDPWKVAKREADKLVIRETMKARDKEARKRRRLPLTEFNPMAIAWGEVEPPPPPKRNRGRRSTQKPNADTPF